ncbi:MAG: diaminopimelate epimerase [Coriobacteriia bacterium]|nr:diaminopimelate epimerase [Coriobacteriia bacterium]
MNISFDKMHGLGNDFIVIEDLMSELELTAQQIQELCDRNFGIGADGIIILRRSSDANSDYTWFFANADGTIPEMCGNGIRCAARFLNDRGHIPEDKPGIVIDTLAGPKHIEVVRDKNDSFEQAIVDMGRADFSSEAIGVDLEPNTALDIEFTTDEDTIETLSLEGVIDHSLVIDETGEEIVITCLSMGNPHTIINVASLGCTIEDAPVHEIGPLIEMHPAFSDRTNVEFIEVIDDRTINVRVWERGCGETLACGTGACASAVYAYIQGAVHDEVTVRLLGGDLLITTDPASLEVRMAGPAELVYAGTVEVKE